MKNYQITSWVHHFLEDHVQPGDICIDATMGNGNDTALLSKLAGESGKVTAFDIQQMALDNTARKLTEEGCTANYQLILESHERMGEYAGTDTVSCITFNLGYLPGGDHMKATKGESRGELESFLPAGLYMAPSVTRLARAISSLPRFE